MIKYKRLKLSVLDVAFVYKLLRVHIHNFLHVKTKGIYILKTTRRPDAREKTSFNIHIHSIAYIYIIYYYEFTDLSAILSLRIRQTVQTSKYVLTHRLYIYAKLQDAFISVYVLHRYHILNMYTLCCINIFDSTKCNIFERRC